MMGRMKTPLLSRPAAGLVMLIAAAPFLSGCFSTGLAVAGLLSGLVDGQPARVSHGTRAQNGKGFDKSIGQALAHADEEVSPACQALLPERDADSGNSTSCSYRMVCLPGAPQPIEMMICKKSEVKLD